MPCLNEALTIARCVRAARECLERHGIAGEIVVADNGSTDGSQDLARAEGARVVDIRDKGYGHALMGGIRAARGRFIIMGDSDLSYDFGEGHKFVERLRAGDELVMGTRFGAGRIMPGAMPLKHRYLGNPVLSFIGRLLFRCPVRDFHCGLRAFTKDAYERLDVRTTGMEFASELVIKATLRGVRISEVPITLHPDGRDRPPHLRSWRDGWRHLRFMLCLSPRWTLFLPGLALLALGLPLAALTAPGPVRLLGVTLDVNTLLAACLFVLVGYLWVTTAVAMRIFGLVGEIGPPSERLQRLFRVFTLERGLFAGAAAALAGTALIAWMALEWALGGFGDTDLARTLRPMIVGSTLVALGVQTVLMSFVYSMLGIRVRR